MCLIVPQYHGGDYPDHARGRKVRPVRYELELREGAYASIPAWQSPAAFRRGVLVAIAGVRWRADRKRNLLAVVDAMIAAADRATGRSVTLAAATMGRKAKVSRATVFRRLADLRELGLMVVVEDGGYLCQRDRDILLEKTGRRVIRKAATRALTTPAEYVTATPPVPSGTGAPSGLSNPNLRRKRQRKRFAQTNSEPRSLRLQRFADRVAHHLPWLLTAPAGGRRPTRHIGALADILAASGLDDSWTPRDIAHAIDAWHARHKRTNLGRAASSRLGWFSWALREALADGAMSETERLAAADRDRELRAEARRRRTAVLEAERAEMPEAMRRARAALEAAAARRAAEREARSATPLSVLLAGKA